MHEGAWEKNPDWCFWDYPLIELAGKTMGVVGFGRIGQATGRMAKALGMRVIANDKYEARRPGYRGVWTGKRCFVSRM